MGFSTWRRLEAGIADLFPGYFALVMATGIVSVAAYLLGMPGIGRGLFAVNVAAYGVLWALTLVRVVRFPRRVLADLVDHGRGPGFFTIVAATCVLANEALLLASGGAIAVWLWRTAVVLWAILMYAFFTGVTIRERKPSLEEGLNGAWLLAVVSTQAVSLATTNLVPAQGPWKVPMLFFALAMFLAGCMLYVLIISLIFYRWTFFSLAAAALTPSYWINMGAVAITSLAGATLILNAGKWSFLVEVQPFLKGFTLFFWSTATWWIPLLVVLTLWRHVRMRYPLAYDPQYWGLVFPLGMYTVCTNQLSRVGGLGFLHAIAGAGVYFALCAWVIGFAGLLNRLWRGLFAGTEGPAADADGEASAGGDAA